jgi:hypothetical protein
MFLSVFWLENLKGRDYSEDLGLGRKILLEWIVGKWFGRVWNGRIWLRTGAVGRLL